MHIITWPRFKKLIGCVFPLFITFFFFFFFGVCFHRKTILLFSSNLMSSRFDEGTPSPRLQLMSHKNPYSSAPLPLELISLAAAHGFISWEAKWTRLGFRTARFSSVVWSWFWWGWVGENEGICWYPHGRVWSWVGGEEALAVVSNTYWGLSLELLSDLVLWKTLHNTQSSCTPWVKPQLAFMFLYNTSF